MSVKVRMILGDLVRLRPVLVDCPRCGNQLEIEVGLGKGGLHIEAPQMVEHMNRHDHGSTEPCRECHGTVQHHEPGCSYRFFPDTRPTDPEPGS